MNAPSVPPQSWDSVFYLEWKRHGQHLQEYASEFIGTAFMVFCVVGVVGLMFAPGSPLAAVLPSARWRLFLTAKPLGRLRRPDCSNLEWRAGGIRRCGGGCRGEETGNN
jgi:hypothetical protein